MYLVWKEDLEKLIKTDKSLEDIIYEVKDILDNCDCADCIECALDVVEK